MLRCGTQRVCRRVQNQKRTESMEKREKREEKKKHIYIDLHEFSPAVQSHTGTLASKTIHILNKKKKKKKVFVFQHHNKILD